MAKIIRSGARGMRCPSCGSSNVSVYNANTEYVHGIEKGGFGRKAKFKSVQTAKTQKKLSMGKLAGGAMTGGLSLLFTGVTKDVAMKPQWLCRQCGCVFEE